MSDLQELTARLRVDLKAAMRGRCLAEVKVLRGLIAAIDDAQAVPVGSLHETYVVRAFGDPSVEVPRRDLGVEDLRRLLESESAARFAAAEEYRAAGHHDRAEELTAAAKIVGRYLDRLVAGGE
ncbi:hypothetical protein HLH33_16740 [Gluconacetobacter diazotrophicus]|uniref:Uncharacterized protein n=1 Tax=Gluconacetobacter diazotrophicus TaxID=33996 RepID=A0A7W4I856_GLUDI|nr:hypothetical protein [Gluconacetobacter diazotrophicus]MBB2157927.1 hypothetical protein [Gluconacetobacter diazotrophicus]